MDSASDVPGSPVAWNGVFLTVPYDWLPATIAPRQLLFTHNDRAVFDCRWFPESAAISAQRKRRMLEKLLDRPEGFTLSPAAIPSFWRTALSSLSSRLTLLPFVHNAGFGALCRHENARASLLLHCPVSELASSGAASGALEDTAGLPGLAGLPMVLNSLGMVRAQEKTVPYAMCDIQFSAPAGYTLSRAEFRPGHTRIEFARGRCLLSVQRFAPANVVLQGQPFRAWIQETQGVTLAEITKDREQLPLGARKRYYWQEAPCSGLLHRLAAFTRRGRGGTGGIGTAWVVENENKLLMVTLHCASSPGDRAAFASLWRSLCLR